MADHNSQKPQGTQQSQSPQQPDQTPLYDLHIERGARMVTFAGYAMPVQYPSGIIKEHQHTRTEAGLFDVSHMGQAYLHGRDGDVAEALETLVPGNITGLLPGQQRYSLLLNENGGILDDLMVSRPPERMGPNRLFLVVNAATKGADFVHIEETLGDRVRLERLDDRALMALQGPKAVDVLARLDSSVADLAFMNVGMASLMGAECLVSRSGYTGEDGFEISVPAVQAEALARRLMAEDEVAPIGLGARDSLRLEAGLCLYGHDIDENTTPVEAGLNFALARRRREEGGFPGASRILKQLEYGPDRLRVGLKLEGRAPAREGAEIINSHEEVVGTVTSGGFGPTIGGPIAMGYVIADFAREGTDLAIRVRGKALPACVASLPFVPHRYKC